MSVTPFSIVFLDADTLGDADLRPLQQQATDLTLYPHTAPSDVLSRLQHADLAIVNKVRLDAATLQALPKLRCICVAATGMNNVDLDAAKQLNIAVHNVTGYAETAVPQHVFALLLQLCNNIQAYHQAVIQGEWSKSPHFCLLQYPITELAGKCFVVIGNGSLGQASARLATAFGMKVIVAEQAHAKTCRPGRVAFDSALAQADVISLHCPLTADTANLFNHDTFAKIKPGAILINTARGGLVDSAALLQALTSGPLSAAALDVLPQEPPATDDILINSGLANLLLTPHTGWASREARQRMVQQLARNIEHFRCNLSL